MCGHHGGAGPRRGMPIIGGLIFDTPEDALLVSALGPQKSAITAAHQSEAALHETDGPIAQIVRFPSAIRNVLFAEENLGDHTISTPRRARVERAYGGAQSLASLFGKLVKCRPRRAPIHCAPQPPGSVRACIEVVVKRQLRHIVGSNRGRLLQPDTMRHGADANDGVPSIGGAPRLTGRKI